MTEEFVPTDNPTPPTSGKTPDEIPPNREPLKHLLIGSPKGVKSAIHSLHVRGYPSSVTFRVF